MNFAQDIVKKFVVWTKLKIRLHHKADDKVKRLYFREKEIWWAHLGKNIGHEEDGKNNNFERPIIVLRKFSRYLFLGVPTSTKIKSKNDFYHTFRYGDQNYSAILSQMRPISTNRLIRRIGSLSAGEFRQIKDKAIQLIKNDSRTNK